MVSSRFPTITALIFSLLFASIKSAPEAEPGHHSDEFRPEFRRGPSGPGGPGGGRGRGHHGGGGWGGNVDWDTTKACFDDFKANDGDCSSFRKCCEQLCESSSSYQADCSVKNTEEAQLLCSCRGGGGGGFGGGGNGGGGGWGPSGGSSIETGETPPYRQWRPRPTRPSPVAPVAETVTFAPARPAGGDKGCGVPTIQPEARIVGGTESKPHSWPWQISLQYRGRHLCGGSVISNTHILTAAHCFGNSKTASSYSVVIGMYDRSSTSGSQTVAVSKIMIHPNYDDNENSHDAAVAILSKPITFSDNVTPICLPAKDVAEGSSCEATGWGETQGTGNNRYLLQVRVPIVPRTTCNDRSHYRGLIDDTMICAGATGKDSCQGDSGGPLVCQRSDGVWEQQGITSWGADCAEVNKPGVYTRVVSVTDFIKNAMKS